MSITEPSIRPESSHDVPVNGAASPTQNSRTDAAQRFVDVRALTDTLASRLSPEDQTPQSMTEASPAKWHRAHVTWFFEEFILRQDPGYRVYDESFRYLFNSYYEAVGERHPRPDRGLVAQQAGGRR